MKSDVIRPDHAVSHGQNADHAENCGQCFFVKEIL